jgi:hypothetical protein
MRQVDTRKGQNRKDMKEEEKMRKWTIRRTKRNRKRKT